MNGSTEESAKAKLDHLTTILGAEASYCDNVTVLDLPLDSGVWEDTCSDSCATVIC